MKPLRLVILLFIALLAGCSQGNQHQTQVTIGPAIQSLAAGVNQTFTATLVHDHHSGLGVTWSLSGAGNLTNSTAFSVTYNAPASVPANPSVTLTATAQVDSTATASVTFNITAGSRITGNNYVGSQSPGDVWLFTLDDVGNQFSATDRATNYSYTGTTAPLVNGFLKTSIVTSNDPKLPAGSSGYAIEIPGVAALLALGGNSDKPVALVAQSPCPTLSGPTDVQLINLGKSTYDSTQSESYAEVNATQSGSSFNLSINSYLLDGTLRSASGQLPSGNCANGIITIPNVPIGGTNTTVTVATASNGLYVVDLGAGNGAAVGSQNFAVDSTTISSAMSAHYIGAIFTRNSSRITTFAGFGPGSGTSISGGAYVNQDTDPFSAHANNVTLNLTSVDTNGFLEGNITESNTGLTHSPFVAMVTQNGGQFFLFGITTDTSTTTPYVILLAQTNVTTARQEFPKLIERRVTQQAN